MLDTAPTLSFDNAPSAEIHLDHIRQNFLLAKQQANAQTMVVIKANAYGHGVAEVAQALDHADAYAVARVVEAVELRRYQPNKTIVVLEGFLTASERDYCIEHRLTPMMHSDYQLDLLPADMPFWLKFNTGMFRLGFDPERAAELATRLTDYSLVGVASHLANADQTLHPMNQKQIDSFELVTQSFGNTPTCFANSGGILNLPYVSDAQSWVRPGIMLYGGTPGDSLRDDMPPELKPGMTLTAPIIAINQLKAGDQVGYGSTWNATEDCRLAVVALGYADGYPREMPAGTPVLIQGQRRKLVGRVSMDMCTVLLEAFDDIQIGERATFWGQNLPIDEIAQCADTINYTLMTGLGPRVQRVFSRR